LGLAAAARAGLAPYLYDFEHGDEATPFAFEAAHGKVEDQQAAGIA
jgi:hypothetical protein